MNEILKNICKIGQGANCCKYLTLDSNGLSCAKLDLEWKKIIDHNWATTQHTAQGDNCEGKLKEELNA